MFFQPCWDLGKLAINRSWITWSSVWIFFPPYDYFYRSEWNLWLGFKASFLCADISRVYRIFLAHTFVYRSCSWVASRLRSFLIYIFRSRLISFRLVPREGFICIWPWPLNPKDARLKLKRGHNSVNNLSQCAWYNTHHDRRIDI